MKKPISLQAADGVHNGLALGPRAEAEGAMMGMVGWVILCWVLLCLF